MSDHTRTEPVGEQRFTETIFLRCEAGLSERIKRVAFKPYPNQRSVSQYIRDAIEAALERDGKRGGHD
jgi:predicted DNA-binding protein